MTTATQYFDDWSESGYQGIRADFSIADDAAFPPAEAILYASYTYENYSGDAWVIYEQDDKLYEVHGGHCSCYGLEGQWEPEATTWEAIAMRPHLPDAVRDLVAARLASVSPTVERSEPNG